MKKLINKLLRRSRYLTLIEAGQRGLLPTRLQNTVEYEVGKFPQVFITDCEVN